MVDTESNYRPCCLHKMPEDKKYSLYEHNWKEWWDSEYMSNLRNSLLQGEQHPGCQTCWKLEEKNITSMRQNIQKEYDILSAKVSSITPLNYELQISNTCNLGCIMCSEKSSSYLLAENKKLNITNLDQKKFNVNSNELSSFNELIDTNSELRALNIRGGEPLISKQCFSFIKNIPDDVKKKLILYITTNATTFTKEWEEELDKFKSIRIMFSADGVEDTFNYIRYPADWKNVSQNIKTMSKKYKSLIHCVVQNLNIPTLDKILDFAINNDIFIQLIWIQEPKILCPTNLPIDIIKKSIEKLKNPKYTHYHIDNRLKDIINTLETSIKNSTNQQNWDKFLNYVNIKDKYRNTNFESIINV